MGSRASCFTPQAGGEEKATQVYSYIFVLEEHYDTSTKAVLLCGMELELHPMPEEEEENYCNDMKNPPVWS